MFSKDEIRDDIKMQKFIVLFNSYIAKGFVDMCPVMAVPLLVCRDVMLERKKQ